MNSEIFHAYTHNGANMLGGDLPFFIGRQYGSGWMSTFAKVAFPIFKKLAKVAENVAQDVIYKEKGVGESIKEQALNVVDEFVNPSINSVTKKRKRISTTNYPFFNKKYRKL